MTIRPLPATRPHDPLERSIRVGILDEARAWALLRALAHRARAGTPVCEPTGLDVDAQGNLLEVAPGAGPLTLLPNEKRPIQLSAQADAKVLELLELYVPLCVGPASATLVVGHLGQSLDGQIATSSGASRYVTGPENIRHLHRLRALFDAVIVGANTVEYDDPQLTTRLVSGPNPTRVVLDPSLRLRGEQRLFGDGAAPTLVLCAASSARSDAFARAEVVGIEGEVALLPVEQVIAALRARGLGRLFVEGGGVTVSRFLEARALDRLHLTVSSVFLGSGRPGVKLPGIDRMEAALRPRVRRFELGEDVLFDCEFERD